MRPDVTVTEFVYAHEIAEKAQRWYTRARRLRHLLRQPGSK